MMSSFHDSLLKININQSNEVHWAERLQIIRTTINFALHSVLCNTILLENHFIISVGRKPIRAMGVNTHFGDD